MSKIPNNNNYNTTMSKFDLWDKMNESFFIRFP